MYVREAERDRQPMLAARRAILLLSLMLVDPAGAVLEWSHSRTGERIVSPWPTDGFDRLPTLWFSANVSGPNSRAELELLSRYDVAIISWGQEMPGRSGKITRDSERAQAAAARAARGYLDSVGNNSTVLGVYRQIQIALGLFNVSHAAALDPDKRKFWLHQLDNATNICGMEPSEGDKPSQWGTYDPYWNFTNQGARDYWLNTFVEEICREHEDHVGFTAVYFDEIDDNWCGYWGNATHGGCWFDNATQIEQAEASYSLYRLMVQKLNDCGIVPIMATFSMMERSIDHGIDPTNPCVMWEDDLLKHLDGLQWARFYEQWPDEFHMRDQWYPGAIEGDRFAQTIANGMLEAQAGIPVVAHVTPHNNSCEKQANVHSRYTPSGFDAFQLAAFYIAQGPNWVWGASGGWTDSGSDPTIGQNCWRQEYDMRCGTPLADATRTGPYTFTRNFTNCDVYVNTNCASCTGAVNPRLYGEIRLKG